VNKLGVGVFNAKAVKEEQQRQRRLFFRVLEAEEDGAL
jgi:hypothetical protein